MEDQVVDEKKTKKREANKRYKQKNREKINEKRKQYRLENKEKTKQYRLENKEKLNDKKKQYRLENKEKISEQNKKYYLENKEKVKELRKFKYCPRRQRENNLIRKYDITLDDYNKMLQEQNGCCAICFVKAENTKNKVLVVDHNHLTGEVRKLLCKACNTSLGLLKESQEIIANLSRYLYENGSCVPEEGR